MDYQNHYNKLIDRAKNRLLEGYTEKHHIIPRCINGSNNIDNIVVLTPEEHYVAHQLLVKIYPNEPKLIYAAHMMTIVSPDHGYRRNKLYGWLRKCHSNLLTGVPRSEEIKQKISKKLKGNIPWNKGVLQSEEHKRKNSESHKGHKVEEKTKRKISKKLKGTKRSEENRRQKSESMKGNKNALGCRHSEEANQKQSESMKKSWAHRKEIQ